MNNNSLKEIKEVIKKSKKILVFTGAGISTNSGIPDFRGENGLYNIVKKYGDLPYPEAIFDINYFRINPKPFFDLSRDLFYEDVRPSLCHKFLAWLEDEGKISLVLTQNIDRVHTMAGSKKVLECHGTYSTAHCQNCNKKFESDEYSSDILNSKIPHCECGGVIKPDVVFFGENLPQEFYDLYYEHPKYDLIMILGSSLTVNPAASLVMSFAQNTPSLIVNLEPTSYDGQITHVLHEDLDEFARIIWDELK